MTSASAGSQDKARRLIEQQPWLDNPEWAARRIVHDPEPHGGALTANLRTGICVLLAIPPAVIAYDHAAWQPLVASAFFLALAAASMFSRLKARHGRSECLLRSLPARIGGALQADVAVRLHANADAPVRASLAALSTVERHVREIWRAEQRIGRGEIRVAEGTWTIPVRISIPATLRATRGLHPVCHIDEFNPVWQLEVQVETAGPDYTAQFHVPVYDLADLPYDAEQGPRGQRRPQFFRLADFMGRELGVGVLVGAILGFAVGFGYASQLRYEQIKGVFLLPLMGAVFAFASLFAWRVAIAQALHDHDPHAHDMHPRLWLLMLAPWAVTGLVLCLAWMFLPFGGIVWGLGMLLCVRSAPFGRFWRDPLFQSGAALVACTVLLLLI